MYILFGIKWSGIFTGRLWSYALIAQTDTLQTHSNKNPRNVSELGSGVTMHDVIQCLRVRTVPSGYTFHMWKPGVFTCIYNLSIWSPKEKLRQLKIKWRPYWHSLNIQIQWRNRIWKGYHFEHICMYQRSILRLRRKRFSMSERMMLIFLRLQCTYHCTCEVITFHYVESS